MRYLLACWRSWWNLCPCCNSDAPAIDHCPVCLGDGDRARLKEGKAELWLRMCRFMGWEKS